jgi:quercetin dioxygenase-like cupin family protein
MGGPHHKPWPGWLCDVAGLFGMRIEEIASLQHVLDDESCWFAGADLNARTVIPLLVPNPSHTGGYLARAPSGALIPRHRHAGRETLLVIRGHLYEQGGGGRHARRGERLVSEPGTEHVTLMLAPTVVAVRIDFIAEAKQSGLDRGIRPPWVKDET